jgi:hypothetical protein
MKIFGNHENRWIFPNYMGKIVRAGAGEGIFDKLEPEPELEPDKNAPAPQHWFNYRNQLLKFLSPAAGLGWGWIGVALWRCWNGWRCGTTSGYCRRFTHAIFTSHGLESPRCVTHGCATLNILVCAELFLSCASVFSCAHFFTWLAFRVLA